MEEEKYTVTIRGDYLEWHSTGTSCAPSICEALADAMKMAEAAMWLGDRCRVRSIMLMFEMVDAVGVYSMDCDEISLEHRDKIADAVESFLQLLNDITDAMDEESAKAAKPPPHPPQTRP